MQQIKDMINNLFLSTDTRLSNEIISITKKLNDLYIKHYKFCYDMNLNLNIKYNNGYIPLKVIPYLYSNYNIKNEYIKKAHMPFIMNFDEGKTDGTRLIIEYDGIHVYCLVDSVKSYFKYTNDYNYLKREVLKKTKEELYVKLDSNYDFKTSLKDLKELNLALDKTVEFYNDFVDLFKNKRIDYFVNKYKNYKEMNCALLMCIHNDFKERFFFAMQKENIKITVNDFYQVINLLEYSSSSKIIEMKSDSPFAQSRIARRMREDLHEEKNGFKLLKSLIFVNKMRDDLNKIDNKAIIKKVKI